MSKKIYYVLTSKPYNVISTESILDLIILLYNGDAEFISSDQQKDLNLPNNYNNIIRKKISLITERVPLYDIMSNHIYLINNNNVFPRIHYDNYRIIDKNFLNSLNKKKILDDFDKDNIRILSHYDLKILYQTYAKLFYESYVINSFITACQRPSFHSGMDHISPYYTINELYYLAYDWNLTSDPKLSQKQINIFCKEISKHDIQAKTLLAHQMYMYDTKTIGLIKYYSLYGSYYMNLYLRNTRCYLLEEKRTYENCIRNYDMENQIKIMVNAIKNAPKFYKNHTVYRFVEKDDYLKDLNVGDIYHDPSFMSTTRNPFYYKENYGFGKILIKIKIPKNINGIGLCIEAYSNFPNEEEIILLPASMYKIIKIVDISDIDQSNISLKEFHNNFNLKVDKKYEFEWIGNHYLSYLDAKTDIHLPYAQVPELSKININEIFQDINIKYMDFSERFIYFKDKYVNVNNQFMVSINNINYIFNISSYDSTSVYKDFFYYETSDGIMVTTSNPKYGNINLILELGPNIHINYYFRYSITDSSESTNLNKKEWIHWLCLFAYIVGSRTITIHSNYIILYNEDDDVTTKQNKTRYPLSQDIYIYLKHKKKMYNFNEIIPNFEYYDLDNLFNYSTDEFIKKTDQNELYRITQKSNIKNMGDLYIYIAENFPKFIKFVEEKIDLIFEPKRNPFRNTSYDLDAWQYLYNNNLINQIPPEREFQKNRNFKKIIGKEKIIKFKNRLRTFLLKDNDSKTSLIRKI